MITLGPARPRRRMSLTPMIDVVFLLLIFFMLAARFGQEGVVALSGGGTGQGWSGPPRLVDFASGEIWLNGAPFNAQELPAALTVLMRGPEDAIVLRPQGEASLQDLVDLSESLQRAGFTRLILVEP